MHIHDAATQYFREHSPESYLAPWSYVVDSGPASAPELIHYTGPDIVIVTNDEDGPVLSTVFDLDVSVLNLHGVTAKVNTLHMLQFVSTTYALANTPNPIFFIWQF